MENKIINTPSDIERSATDGPVTRRSLYTNTAQNRNLPTKLQLAVNGSFAGQTKFDEFVQFESIEQLHQALSELMIRFDTRPDYYTKKDYQLLIGILVGSIEFLHAQSTAEIPDVEALIKDVNNLIETVIPSLQEEIASISNLQTELKDLSNKVLVSIADIEQCVAKSEKNESSIEDLKDSLADLKVETAEEARKLQSEIGSLKQYDEQIQIEVSKLNQNLSDYKVNTSQQTDIFQQRIEGLEFIDADIYNKLQVLEKTTEDTTSKLQDMQFFWGTDSF